MHDGGGKQLWEMAAKAGKANRIKVEKRVGGVVTRDPLGLFQRTLSDLGHLAGVHVFHTAHSPTQGNRQTQRRTEFVVGTEEV